MKKIFLMITIFLLSNPGFPQTPAEWINQQNTQTKYLLQQIALYQLYLYQVQKGYSIAHTGLTTIGYRKDGERQLHADFFRSRQQVNPLIRNSPQVAAILSLQLKVQQTCHSTLQLIKQTYQFNPEEQHYLQRLMANLVHDSRAELEDLVTVITVNQWEMNDGQRFRRLQALYEAMQEKHTLAQQFSNEAKVLSWQRVKEQNVIKTSRALYGLKDE